MKYIRTILAVLLAGFAMQATAQDSLWVRYDNRFKANRFVMDISAYDSIEFRSKGTLPILRKYGSQYSSGYQDYTLTGVNDGTSALVIGDPGLILWKPTTSDASYNNDYTVDTNRWCFAHSKESDHFVVFWDKTYGDLTSGAVKGSVSGLTVNITNLLAKAEQFYKTNVENLQMCVVGTGKSQLDKYKMAIYLLDTEDWVATGSGNDNVIGTLWVSPNTCQPVGSTIAHEIGHSFQYQTYCDNIIRGKANNMKSGFRYGYPDSNGGCGFWEQCAQWQSFQDYPSEAITSYNFDVWIANCHRHFEHEWQRYASYWEQYYWTEKNGISALGRIWNESAYPEDANQCYMRLFCDNNYDTLRTQLFDYAQHTATFDYKAIRAYVGTKYNNYSTTFYNVDNGFKQISYKQCPQPTGFNVIPLSSTTAGKQVTVTLRALAAGSALATGDPGTQVDGDGKSVGTTTTYNATDIAGHEGLAFGFVSYKGDGTRDYSPMTLATVGNDVVATYTLPEKVKKAWVVVQGSPDQYYQCPWDEKESTDDQLPYQIKIEE